MLWSSNVTVAFNGKDLDPIFRDERTGLAWSNTNAFTVWRNDLIVGQNWFAVETRADNISNAASFAMEVTAVTGSGALPLRLACAQGMLAADCMHAGTGRPWQKAYIRKSFTEVETSTDVRLGNM